MIVIRLGVNSSKDYISLTKYGIRTLAHFITNELEVFLHANLAHILSSTIVHILKFWVFHASYRTGTDFFDKVWFRASQGQVTTKRKPMTNDYEASIKSAKQIRSEIFT